jgi:prepilin-type N-terminal cleavage/methylation domain-containing protein
MLQGARKRTAMTLVELLVVMAIIVIFTAMTAAFYPANQADRELSRFSNTVQSALLSARNRAKAERLPTGLRFYADTNVRTKVGSVVLIQKPAPLDAYAVGVASNPGSLSVTIVERTPVPMPGGIFDAYITFPNTYPVQNNVKVGDLIVLESGDVAKVDEIVAQTVTYPNTIRSYGGANPIVGDPPNYIDVTKSYSLGFSSSLNIFPNKFKVYRSPVELSGDTPFELSNTIEIQMPNTPLYRLEPTGQPFLTALPSNPPFVFTPSFTQATYFPPQRPGPPPPLTPPPSYMEIIFNPDGTLNNSTSDVYLHLHNFESLFGTAPSYSDGNFSRDAILAVRKMSGSIGVYEVGQMINFTPIPPSQPNATGKFLILYNSANHQPYQFAIDPRNKGI